MTVVFVSLLRQYIKFIVDNQIDKLGMHKSYNLLEHSKFINNLNEIKNILQK